MCLLVNFKWFRYSFPKHLDSAGQAAAFFFVTDTEPIICRFLFNQTAWAGRKVRMVPKCQPNIFKNESKISGEVNTVAVFMCSFIPECLFKAFVWGGGVAHN